jgi:hypothetical protein
VAGHALFLFAAYENISDQLGVVCESFTRDDSCSTVRCAFSGGTASGRNLGSLAVNHLRAGMSGFGPRLPTCALRQVGSYLEWTGKWPDIAAPVNDQLQLQKPQVARSSSSGLVALRRHTPKEVKP